MLKLNFLCSYREKKFNDIHNEIITLCGSTKFKREFETINIALTSQSNIVLTVVCFTHFDQINISSEEKEAFDRAHLKKIDISDSIFVIDVNGYVGESTGKEIQYALSKGKIVRYLSEFI